MRFITGGIMHETHTFATEPTPIDAFAALRGEEAFSRTGTNHSLGGVIDACLADGIELAPTLFASAPPAGTPSRQTFETLLTELTASIAAALPADGIVLTLHGAMVAEGFPDAETEIIRRVRLITNDQVPLAVTLDLHANIGQEMLEGVSIITCYDTYPHIDANDRAQEAVRLLARTVKGEIAPVMAFAQPPLIPVPQAIFSSAPPFSTLYERVHAMEESGEALTVTLAGGFAYSDIPGAGIGIVVTTNNDPAGARKLADEMADLAWSLRWEMQIENVDPAEAVVAAMRSDQTPVILVDVADNIGGGTPGDGTVLLSELLRHGASDAVIVINDPGSAQQAIAAGVGEQVSLRIGGKTDHLHGAPVIATATVRSLSDGRWVQAGPENAGVPVDMGPTAVVQIDGVTVVLTSRKTAPGDLNQLRCVGIEPTEQRIIVVKSAVRWRGGYGPIFGESIDVDTPGLGSVDLRRFPFQHLRRPVFPFDQDIAWSASGETPV